ncbi:MAG: 3-dehydroquinate synthase [Planctomycetales bacterium]|nr:3-dehydroquinate synthase [Planctomycetales bacterium]
MTNINQRVVVELVERSYPIEIGSGIVADVAAALSRLQRVTKAMVISDENVATHYASVVDASLRQAGIEFSLLRVPAGEVSKSAANAEMLWRKMLDLGADRSTVVIALGGGVVGDLAGFVAATYARGIPFFQIPTTLLAQVDSSVGGKVGINLPGAKNMVGAFWQPIGVLIDIDVLTTLPIREYRAGLAEVVKYGMILDADFFQFLCDRVEPINTREPNVLAEIVACCCQLKADVVREDERELTGRRSVLNYGHTFCHAIEAATEYGAYLHGEAVAIGMLCASRLAERLGRIDADVTQLQEDLLNRLELPTKVPENLQSEDLLALMQRDKKVEHGKLRYVLPTRVGHVELVDDVQPSDALAAIEASR